MLATVAFYAEHDLIVLEAREAERPFPCREAISAQRFHGATISVRQLADSRRSSSSDVQRAALPRMRLSMLETSLTAPPAVSKVAFSGFVRGLRPCQNCRLRSAAARPASGLRLLRALLRRRRPHAQRHDGARRDAREGAVQRSVSLTAPPAQTATRARRASSVDDRRGFMQRSASLTAPPAPTDTRARTALRGRFAAGAASAAGAGRFRAGGFGFFGGGSSGGAVSSSSRPAAGSAWQRFGARRRLHARQQ